MLGKLTFKNYFTFAFSLLEKGKQILMKDNLIDDEKAKKEEAAQESLEGKLERIGIYNCQRKNIIALV